MKLPFFLARRFVAGENLEQALPVIQQLNEKGLFTAIDLLGEYVDDLRVSTAARDAYINLIRTLADRGSQKNQRGNISIKLSMLGQKIDESICLENLDHLLTVARETDTFVRLDMEGSDMTSSTLSIFEKVYPKYPDNVGIVLQAYLKRTSRDVKRMCEMNARVRICKGAYKEPPAIAFQNMSDIREHFIAHMQTLITGGRYPAIATHDDILINATKRFVAENGISNDRFEFQMLYGIRPITQDQLLREGYHMRVYVPYGTEWFPYYARRLRERKENVWFILKNLVRS